VLALVAALLAAAPAERWSLYGGETVAAGQDVLVGEVGWPATSLGWGPWGDADGMTASIELIRRAGLVPLSPAESLVQFDASVWDCAFRCVPSPSAPAACPCSCEPTPA